jgi:cytochrome c
MVLSHWKPAALALCLALVACGNKTAAPAAAGDGTAPVQSGATPATGPGRIVNLADLPAPFNEADLDNGATIFIKCRNCHSAVPSEGNKTGPNLHGVFDRHPGTQVNFKYSDAMRHNPHDKWTGEELDKWLTGPKTYLPGSSMFFAGVENPKDRRDVIAYLMIQTEK